MSRDEDISHFVRSHLVGFKKLHQSLVSRNGDGLTIDEQCFLDLMKPVYEDYCHRPQIVHLYKNILDMQKINKPQYNGLLLQGLIAALCKCALEVFSEPIWQDKFPLGVDKVQLLLHLIDKGENFFKNTRSILQGKDLGPEYSAKTRKWIRKTVGSPSFPSDYKSSNQEARQRLFEEGVLFSPSASGRARLTGYGEPELEFSSPGRRRVKLFSEDNAFPPSVRSPAPPQAPKLSEYASIPHDYSVSDPDLLLSNNNVPGKSRMVHFSPSSVVVRHNFSNIQNTSVSKNYDHVDNIQTTRNVLSFEDSSRILSEPDGSVNLSYVTLKGNEYDDRVPSVGLNESIDSVHRMAVPSSDLSLSLDELEDLIDMGTSSPGNMLRNSQVGAGEKKNVSPLLEMSQLESLLDDSLQEDDEDVPQEPILMRSFTEFMDISEEILEKRKEIPSSVNSHPENAGKISHSLDLMNRDSSVARAQLAASRVHLATSLNVSNSSLVAAATLPIVIPVQLQPQPQPHSKAWQPSLDPSESRFRPVVQPLSKSFSHSLAKTFRTGDVSDEAARDSEVEFGGHSAVGSVKGALHASDLDSSIVGSVVGSNFVAGSVSGSLSGTMGGSSVGPTNDVLVGRVPPGRTRAGVRSALQRMQQQPRSSDSSFVDSSIISATQPNPGADSAVNNTSFGPSDDVTPSVSSDYANTGLANSVTSIFSKNQTELVSEGLGASDCITPPGLDAVSGRAAALQRSLDLSRKQSDRGSLELAFQEALQLTAGSHGIHKAPTPRSGASSLVTDANSARNPLNMSAAPKNDLRTSINSPFLLSNPPLPFSHAVSSTTSVSSPVLPAPTANRTAPAPTAKAAAVISEREKEKERLEELSCSHSIQSSLRLSLHQLLPVLRRLFAAYALYGNHPHALAKNQKRKIEESSLNLSGFLKLCGDSGLLAPPPQPLLLALQTASDNVRRAVEPTAATAAITVNKSKTVVRGELNLLFEGLCKASLPPTSTDSNCANILSNLELSATNTNNDTGSRGWNNPSRKDAPLSRKNINAGKTQGVRQLSFHEFVRALAFLARRRFLHMTWSVPSSAVLRNDGESSKQTQCFLNLTSDSSSFVEWEELTQEEVEWLSKTISPASLNALSGEKSPMEINEDDSSLDLDIDRRKSLVTNFNSIASLRLLLALHLLPVARSLDPPAFRSFADLSLEARANALNRLGTQIAHAFVEEMNAPLAPVGDVDTKTSGDKKVEAGSRTTRMEKDSLKEKSSVMDVAEKENEEERLFQELSALSHSIEAKSRSRQSSVQIETIPGLVTDLFHPVPSVVLNTPGAGVSLKENQGTYSSALSVPHKLVSVGGNKVDSGIKTFSVNLLSKSSDSSAKSIDAWKDGHLKGHYHNRYDYGPISSARRRLAHVKSRVNSHLKPISPHVKEFAPPVVPPTGASSASSSIPSSQSEMQILSDTSEMHGKKEDIVSNVPHPLLPADDMMDTASEDLELGPGASPASAHSYQNMFSSNEFEVVTDYDSSSSAPASPSLPPIMTNSLSPTHASTSVDAANGVRMRARHRRVHHPSRSPSNHHHPAKSHQNYSSSSSDGEPLVRTFSALSAKSTHSYIPFHPQVHTIESVAQHSTSAASVGSAESASGATSATSTPQRKVKFEDGLTSLGSSHLSESADASMSQSGLNFSESSINASNTSNFVNLSLTHAGDVSKLVEVPKDPLLTPATDADPSSLLNTSSSNVLGPKRVSELDLSLDSSVKRNHVLEELPSSRRVSPVLSPQVLVDSEVEEVPGWSVAGVSNNTGAIGARFQLLPGSSAPSPDKLDDLNSEMFNVHKQSVPARVNTPPRSNASSRAETPSELIHGTPVTPLDSEERNASVSPALRIQIGILPVEGAKLSHGEQRMALKEHRSLPSTARSAVISPRTRVPGNGFRDRSRNRDIQNAYLQGNSRSMSPEGRIPTFSVALSPLVRESSVSDKKTPVNITIQNPSLDRKSADVATHSPSTRPPLAPTSPSLSPPRTRVSVVVGGLQSAPSSTKKEDTPSVVGKSNDVSNTKVSNSPRSVDKEISAEDTEVPHSSRRTRRQRFAHARVSGTSPLKYTGTRRDSLTASSTDIKHGRSPAKWIDVDGDVGSGNELSFISSNVGTANVNLSQDTANPSANESAIEGASRARNVWGAIFEESNSTLVSSPSVSSVSKGKGLDERTLAKFNGFSTPLVASVQVSVDKGHLEASANLASPPLNHLVRSSSAQVVAQQDPLDHLALIQKLSDVSVASSNLNRSEIEEERSLTGAPSGADLLHSISTTSELNANSSLGEAATEVMPRVYSYRSRSNSLSAESPSKPILSTTNGWTSEMDNDLILSPDVRLNQSDSPEAHTSAEAFVPHVASTSDSAPISLVESSELRTGPDFLNTSINSQGSNKSEYVSSPESEMHTELRLSPDPLRDDSEVLGANIQYSLISELDNTVSNSRLLSNSSEFSNHLDFYGGLGASQVRSPSQNKLKSHEVSAITTFSDTFESIDHTFSTAVMNQTSTDNKTGGSVVEKSISALSAEIGAAEKIVAAARADSSALWARLQSLANSPEASDASSSSDESVASVAHHEIPAPDVSFQAASPSKLASSQELGMSALPSGFQNAKNSRLLSTALSERNKQSIAEVDALLRMSRLSGISSEDNTASMNSFDSTFDNAGEAEDVPPEAVWMMESKTPKKKNGSSKLSKSSVANLASSRVGGGSVGGSDRKVSQMSERLRRINEQFESLGYFYDQNNNSVSNVVNTEKEASSASLAHSRVGGTQSGIYSRAEEAQIHEEMQRLLVPVSATESSFPPYTSELTGPDSASAPILNIFGDYIDSSAKNTADSAAELAQSRYNNISVADSYTTPAPTRKTRSRSNTAGSDATHGFSSVSSPSSPSSAKNLHAGSNTIPNVAHLDIGETLTTPHTVKAQRMWQRKLMQPGSREAYSSQTLTDGRGNIGDESFDPDLARSYSNDNNNVNLQLHRQWPGSADHTTDAVSVSLAHSFNQSMHGVSTNYTGIAGISNSHTIPTDNNHSDAAAASEGASTNQKPSSLKSDEDLASQPNILFRIFASPAPQARHAHLNDSESSQSLETTQIDHNTTLGQVLFSSSPEERPLRRKFTWQQGLTGSGSLDPTAAAESADSSFSDEFEYIRAGPGMGLGAVTPGALIAVKKKSRMPVSPHPPTVATASIPHQIHDGISNPNVNQLRENTASSSATAAISGTAITPNNDRDALADRMTIGPSSLQQLSNTVGTASTAPLYRISITATGVELAPVLGASPTQTQSGVSLHSPSSESNLPIQGSPNGIVNYPSPLVPLHNTFQAGTETPFAGIGRKGSLSQSPEGLEVSPTHYGNATVHSHVRLKRSGSVEIISSTTPPAPVVPLHSYSGSPVTHYDHRYPQTELVNPTSTPTATVPFTPTSNMGNGGLGELLRLQSLLSSKKAEPSLALPLINSPPPRRNDGLAHHLSTHAPSGMNSVATTTPPTASSTPIFSSTASFSNDVNTNSSPATSSVIPAASNITNSSIGGLGGTTHNFFSFPTVNDILSEVGIDSRFLNKSKLGSEV